MTVEPTTLTPKRTDSGVTVAAVVVPSEETSSVGAGGQQRLLPTTFAATSSTRIANAEIRGGRKPSAVHQHSRALAGHRCAHQEPGTAVQARLLLQHVYVHVYLHVYRVPHVCTYQWYVRTYTYVYRTRTCTRVLQYCNKTEETFPNETYFAVAFSFSCCAGVKPARGKRNCKSDNCNTV